MTDAELDELEDRASKTAWHADYTHAGLQRVVAALREARATLKSVEAERAALQDALGDAEHEIKEVLYFHTHGERDEDGLPVDDEPGRKCFPFPDDTLDKIVAVLKASVDRGQERDRALAAVLGSGHD